MKILFCIDAYRPSRGGAEGYLRDLAAALKKRGHRSFVAAREAEPDGIAEILSLRPPAHPRLIREYLLARAPERFRARGGFDAVVAFRHAFGADLFQPHGGLHAESLKGEARAFSRSGFFQCIAYGRKLLSPKNLFFLYADRRLVAGGGLRAVAALSRMTAEPIERCTSGKVEIRIIPNGVDRRRFHPGLRAAHRSRVLAEEGLPRDAAVGLFLGHNFVLKGLEAAVRAAARCRPARFSAFHLLVAGRGKPDRFLSLARRLGFSSRLRFLGERSDPERLLGASDVLVHPTFYDPCSLVVLEAFGAGVPVVTTRFNGAAELMTDGREGIVLSDPRDVTALAGAIERILGSPHEKFRAAAADLGKRCDFEKHVNRMEELLQRVSRNSRPPSRGKNRALPHGFFGL